MSNGVFSSSILNGNYGGKADVHQTCGFLNVEGRVIFQVAAVFLGFGATGLAGGFVFGMIAGGIVGLRFLDLRFARFGIHHLQSLFFFSFRIFLAAGGSLVFSYADVVLIGYFMENADVGVYRVAFQFTTAATFKHSSFDIGSPPHNLNLSPYHYVHTCFDPHPTHYQIIQDIFSLIFAHHPCFHKVQD